MRSLVDDLLAKAQIDAGFMRVRIVDLDLAQVASETIKAVAWMYSRPRSPWLRKRGPGPPPTPTGLPRSCAISWSNAVRYGAEPITVEVGESGAPSVSPFADHGSGLPEHLAYRFGQPPGEDQAGRVPHLPGPGSVAL